jgi:hypothetical protein
MKRITIGLVLLAFLAEPVLVFAQDSNQREEQIEKKKEENNPLLRQYHERQKENAAIERQYQRTLRATDQNTAPVHVDPWANMRGTDASKTKR